MIFRGRNLRPVPEFWVTRPTTADNPALLLTFPGTTVVITRPTIARSYIGLMEKTAIDVILQYRLMPASEEEVMGWRGNNTLRVIRHD